MNIVKRFFLEMIIPPGSFGMGRPTLFEAVKNTFFASKNLKTPMDIAMEILRRKKRVDVAKRIVDILQRYMTKNLHEMNHLAHLLEAMVKHGDIEKALDSLVKEAQDSRSPDGLN